MKNLQDIVGFRGLEFGDEPMQTPNRAQRRAFRRAFHKQYRQQTRFIRRAWRGVISQQEILAIVRGLDKQGHVILKEGQ